MPNQPVTIKVWCREEDLQQTAGLLSWAVGHRVEIPTVPTGMVNAYFFVITDIEQYDNEDTVRKSMGFDIIGKISGVIDWEFIFTKEAAPQPTAHENTSIDTWLITMLDALPIPISIIKRDDGSYTWKWLNANGQAETYMDAIKAALIHVMKSYSFIRSELIG